MFTVDKEGSYTRRMGRKVNRRYTGNGPYQHNNETW